MKLFRYRKPSLKTALGVTKIVRKARKASGLSTIDRYAHPSRIKGSIKQKVGLYSAPAKVIRQTSKGNFPSFLGLFDKKLNDQ